MDARCDGEDCHAVVHRKCHSRNVHLQARLCETAAKALHIRATMMITCHSISRMSH